MPNYVPGVGPLEPKLMIIGEAPGKNEDEKGEPFVGASGYLLDLAIMKGGSHRSNCYLTNVVKYRPPMNDLSKLHLIGVDVEKEIDNLWKNEINVYRPNCILAIGNLALEAVTGHSGILKYRGSILRAKDGRTKVIPTIHPAALFSRNTGGSNSDDDEDEEKKGGLSYVYLKLIEFDIKRAIDESNTSDIVLPDRELRVIHNSLDLYRFFRRYEDSVKCSVDIESINCVPVSIGFAFNKNHAVSVPLYTRIGSHELSQMGEAESDECWKMIDTELRRVKIIGQNFKYDEFKLNRIGFETPVVYSDTLIKTRVLFPELPDKKLHVQATLWTREPYYKEEGKEFKLGKSPISQLLLYNAKDCAVTFEIDEEQEKDIEAYSERFNLPLKSYYYDYMMRKHKFYLEMENVGFAVDFDKKKKLSEEYTQYQKVTHAQLTNSLGYDVNVKSYPQMYQLLYKHMKFRPFKKSPTSEDSIVRLLQSHCKGKDAETKKEILELILEERRIRDQKSRYINFHPDYDRRCKSSFNISATETCRSSASILKKTDQTQKNRIGLSYYIQAWEARKRYP